MKPVTADFHCVAGAERKMGKPCSKYKHAIHECRHLFLKIHGKVGKDSGPSCWMAGAGKGPELSLAQVSRKADRLPGDQLQDSFCGFERCPQVLRESHQWAFFGNCCALSLEAQRPGLALTSWTQFPLGGFHLGSCSGRAPGARALTP